MPVVTTSSKLWKSSMRSMPAVALACSPSCHGIGCAAQPGAPAPNASRAVSPAVEVFGLTVRLLDRSPVFALSQMAGFDHTPERTDSDRRPGRCDDLPQ